MTQQATRHARRVYVGGLPPMANEAVSGSGFCGGGLSSETVYPFLWSWFSTRMLRMKILKSFACYLRMYCSPLLEPLAYKHKTVAGVRFSVGRQVLQPSASSHWWYYACFSRE